MVWSVDKLSLLEKEELKGSLTYNEGGVFLYKKTLPRVGTKGKLVRIGAEKDGYATVSLFNKTYLAHRLAYFLKEGIIPQYIDHIDHDKLNFAWNNIRPATKEMNSKNCPKRVDNTSGQVGVSYRKCSNKWRAEITSKGVKYRLGDFISFNNAVLARKEGEATHGFHKNHGS